MPGIRLEFRRLAIGRSGGAIHCRRRSLPICIALAGRRTDALLQTAAESGAGERAVAAFHGREQPGVGAKAVRGDEGEVRTIGRAVRQTSIDRIYAAGEIAVSGSAAA